VLLYWKEGFTSVGEFSDRDAMGIRCILEETMDEQVVLGSPHISRRKNHVRMLPPVASCNFFRRRQFRYWCPLGWKPALNIVFHYMFVAVRLWSNTPHEVCGSGKLTIPSCCTAAPELAQIMSQHKPRGHQGQ
jgi:hypothetical protein